jgi:uncharacterized protein DUF4333
VTARRCVAALLAPAALALASGGLLTACARSEVDRAQLETQVQRSLEARARPALQVRTVSCPDRLLAERGAQTHCWITTAAGKTVSALVTVTGTVNNRLQFDLKLEQNPS